MQRFFQKPIEWVIAVKLERYYTKQEIIALYLNYFDFLHNAVGIKTAANTYFNKEPKDLTVCEAATLIGLCKNPSLFNPVRYPDRCRERRNVVLQQMVKAGYMDRSEYAKYSAEPLTLDFHRTDHKDGTATYLREFLRQYMTAKRPVRSDYPSWSRVQFVIDSIAWDTDPLYGWCNKNFKKDGTPYNVYADGLRVFTTIDSRMQKYAEEAVYKHVAGYLQPAFDRENKPKPSAPFSDKLTPNQIRSILNRSITQSERYRTMKAAGYSPEEIHDAFRKKVEMTVFTYHGDIDTLMSPLDSIRYYKGFLRSGFMSMDPKTGAVKAYVGGLDYTHFMYDMVSLGRRQVGSTIKPFLYSLAMENGFTPCDMAPNRQQTYIVAGRRWTPRNANHSRYGQMVPLKWGLAQSNNWISAYLMSKLNPQQFVQLLRDYGINNPDIHASMSLCLGPCEVSVSEMVSAYTAFANHGIRTALCEPHRGQRRQHDSHLPAPHERGNQRRQRHEDAYHADGRGRSGYGGTTEIPLQHGGTDRSEDGNHQQQQRRMVHWLHTAVGDRLLGGRRGPRHPLRLHEYGTGSHDGAPHLGHLHEEGLCRPDAGLQSDGEV